MKLLQNNKSTLLFFFLILLVTLYLRTLNLTSIPVFVDEAIYVRWSQVMRAEQSLRFLPLSDGKQPFFMWLTIPFLKMFTDPLVAGRMVSAISGLGSAVGVFVLSYVLFKSKRASLIALLIYALSPFSVFFDRLALADSLLSFFGIWTAIFMLLTARYKRLDTSMITGFFLGGALLTKSPALYFALLLPTSIIFTGLKGKINKKLSLFSTYAFLLAVTYFLSFAIYSILRLGPNFHMIAIRNKDYVYPISHVLTSPFDPLKPFLDRSLEYYQIMGPWPIVILALVGVLWYFKSYKKEILFLSAWIFIPIFISSEYSKVMTARYIYFSFPFAAVLASVAFVKFDLKNNLPRLVFAVLVLFVTLSINTNIRILTNPQQAFLPRSERSGFLEEWTAGYGIKEVADYVITESKKLPEGKRIVVGTEGYFGTLPDGLQIYLNRNPEITVVGVGHPIRELPIPLLESKRSQNITYLVVNSSRLLAHPDDIGLRLVRSYDKAYRPDGSRESLLLLEVR